MISTTSFSDQLGNSIVFNYPPQRIISLVPSQTELLYDLGLDAEVIGITKFCIYPKRWLSEKTIIGGTKNFWFAVIDELKPDLIIGNKEENYKAGIEKLREKHPVWMSDICSLEDALSMIEIVGPMVNRASQAHALIAQIKEAFETIIKTEYKNVLYLIWRNPWMAAAKNTFIDVMLGKIGLRNCLHGYERYPTLTNDEISFLKPDLIFLSSEPFPFEAKHIDELQKLSPSSKIMLVDGELFSWYGSRLLKAPSYFNSLNFTA